MRKGQTPRAVILEDWAGTRDGHWLGTISDDAFAGWVAAMTLSNHNDLMLDGEAVYRLVRQLVAEQAI